MNEQVQIIFEGYKEILQVINNRESIVKLLGLPSENCPLIGSEIKLGDMVGEGNFGKVYIINMKGMGDKKFVVKKGTIDLSVGTVEKGEFLKILKQQGLEWKDIENIQYPKTKEKFKQASMDTLVENVIIPSGFCLLSNNRQFNSIPQSYTRKTVEVPKGSYLCGDNNLSEYIISACTGSLYRSNKCANFFNIYNMFACTSQRELYDQQIFRQYIFMDKLDGDIKNKCEECTNSKYMNNSDIVNSVYVQTIFAIACYQRNFMISHNDLHTGNVFFEYVNKNTIFNGEYLYDAKWYHYNILGSDIYIPAVKPLVKIGDYGLSVKYSKPIVGDLKVFQDGYNMDDEDDDEEDKSGPWIPNVFMPSYDSLYFTGAFIAKIISNQVDKYGNYGNIKTLEPFINECLEFMCPRIKGQKDTYDALTTMNYLKSQNGRPVLEKLNDVMTALETLKGPVLDVYGKKPLSGKIVTLGILD